MSLLDLFDDHEDPSEWYADVERRDAVSWRINLTNGLSVLHPGRIVFGTRQRAERVARRKLTRYRRKLERENGHERFEVVIANGGPS